LPKDQKSKVSRGFTIMEVALASTVLALTLVGMIGAIESGTQMLDLSRKQTIAAQIIHDEIDQLRLQGWSTVTSIPSTYTSVAIPTVFTTVGGNFSCQYKATQTKDLHGNTIPVMQVTFLVSWTGVTGHSYSRTGITFVSQNGLTVSYQRS
jgi:Tfp pilus assembly protein PilV